MQNLGKILLLTFVCIQGLHASISASVDASNVEFGEQITYSLTLSGEDIKKPDIFSLCGEDVVATGSATSIQIVNGNYEKSYVLSYQFIASKSCTIEPIEIEIGGSIHKTDSIDITVSKHVSSVNDDFSLVLSSGTDELYVGEEFELTLLFRQKKSAKVVDNKFVKPEFKGFWIKGEPRQEVIQEKEFVNTKVIYTLAPQRVGELSILPAQIGIASRHNTKNYWGGFFPEVKWKSYFSNELKIISKALPVDVDLVGDFSIEALVDKTDVNPNEAVNVTIQVRGKGNLEDITSFKPYVNGLSIFDEKILIKDNLLSQKITFVGDSSFTVPSFSLKVFNPQTKEIKTISTQVIDINIKNSIKKEEVLEIYKEKELSPVTVKTATVVEEKIDKFFALGLLVLGIFIGILMMLVRPFLVFKTKKSLNLKDHKVLLVKLMPYKENKDVKIIVDILENNLYKEEKISLNKKDLKAVVNKYAIH